MKISTTLLTSLAIAAGVYSTASLAQSGTPSRQEIGTSASRDVVSNDDVQVNDYARYLMVVDGMRQADAVVKARNYPTSNSLKLEAPRNTGSYARYLMLIDGLRYEDAIVEAAVQDKRPVAWALVAR